MYFLFSKSEENKLFSSVEVYKPQFFHKPSFTNKFDTCSCKYLDFLILMPILLVKLSKV